MQILFEKSGKIWAIFRVIDYKAEKLINVKICKANLIGFLGRLGDLGELRGLGYLGGLGGVDWKGVRIGL